MRRGLTLLACCCSLLTGGCSGTGKTVTAGDTLAVVTNAQVILTALASSGRLPPAVAADGSLVIAGVEAVLTAYEQTAPSSTAEQTALATAGAAVQALLADCHDVRVQQAGALALTAIGAARTQTTAAAQAEAALSSVLLDVLATATPVAANVGAPA